MAVALTLAWPPAITAELAESVAEAPSLAGATVKLTTPPFTGSTGLLAVTITARELANAEPTLADCGVLALTGGKVNPWLSKAPISVVP